MQAFELVIVSVICCNGDCEAGCAGNASFVPVTPERFAAELRLDSEQQVTQVCATLELEVTASPQGPQIQLPKMVRPQEPVRASSSCLALSLPK